MTRVRVLQDPASGKTWGTHCDGAVVKIRSGAPGKEKESEKPQADAKAAESYASKEEMARLRKGFVLVNPAAGAGELRMHRHLVHGYTGSLIAADVGGMLLTNACEREADGRNLHDKLLCVGADARETETIQVPSLAWRVEYMPGLGRILVRSDHQILSWSLTERRFEALTKGNRRPVSFLSAAGTRGAWYDEPDVVVADLARGTELLRRRFEPELARGHSLQMEGALSPDAETLALSARQGEVALLDVASGEAKATFVGDFGMVKQLLFAPDGRYLVMIEQYGKWRLMCFDLTSATPRADWPSWGDRANCAVAIEPSGRRLAVAFRGKIEVFTLATMTSELSFPVDHVVKQCAIAWVGRDLGVRTDLGCASLYAAE